MSSRWRAGRSSRRKEGASALGTIVVASLVLGELAPRVDDRNVPWLASRMGEPQTVALLSSVASGMMVFTGITFSLLFVLLQFGSTAYSPRIVAIVARPRILGRAGGTFIGTFLYALMALRGVGALSGGQTSSLTVWVAFAWLFGSVWMLIRLVEFVASLLQANVLYLLGDTGRREISRMYSPLPAAACVNTPTPLGPPTRTLVHQGPPRYLLAIDVEGLVALARAAGAVVRVPASIGDPIAAGAVLATVHGGGLDIPASALRDAFRLDRDRVLEDDPKYALRLLVDVAIRALAPGLNEPTTAVLALDQIESILAILGGLQLEVGEVCDASGALRLVYEVTRWEEYLELAVAEIQHYGAGSVQVGRRLAALFDFLIEQVPTVRRDAVERLAQGQLASLGRHFPDSIARAQAAQRDRQGFGHSRDRPHIR